MLVIQGTADTHGKLTQEEVNRTVDFCLNAVFSRVDPIERDAVLKQTEDLKVSGQAQSQKELERYLTPDEMHIFKTIRAQEMVRLEDHIMSLTSDIIDGRALHMVHTALGLRYELGVPVAKKRSDISGQMLGEGKE